MLLGGSALVGKIEELLSIVLQVGDEEFNAGKIASVMLFDIRQHPTWLVPGASLIVEVSMARVQVVWQPMGGRFKSLAIFACRSLLRQRWMAK